MNISKLDLGKELHITLSPNKHDQTPKISDTGIEMAKADLHNSLNTMANMALKRFVNLGGATALSSVGQFGVGFSFASLMNFYIICGYCHTIMAGLTSCD